MLVLNRNDDYNDDDYNDDDYNDDDDDGDDNDYGDDADDIIPDVSPRCPPA